MKSYILWILIQEAIYINNRRKELDMSTATREAINLMEILPESDQKFALEFIKKLVLAWDPDYTKVTEKEKAELDEAVREMQAGETVSHNDINWD